MQNKATKLTGLLTLSLVLAGCGEIIARPANYDDLLVDEATHEINNKIKVIYDKYAKTNTSKDQVLNEVLLALAESEIGKYEDLDAETKTLVDDRALEKFFNEVSSGSYEFRSVFNEEHYVVDMIYKNNYHLVSEGESVGIKELGDLTFYNEGLFLAHIDETNFTLPANKLVHVEYYADYLQDKFVPEVYRDLLVENYVKEEQAATIGRNYARKVTYVAIEDSTTHPEAARKLVNAFIDTNILGGGNSDLQILANAWRGVATDFIANEATLLATAGLVDTVNNIDTTLYGEILKKYDKIKTDEKLTDKAIENEFTNNGAYTKETGLEIKTNDLRKKDLVVSEWAIKNGGLSNLPESIRNRVFNIGTANGVDFVEDDLGVVADAGKVNIDISSTNNTFVRNIFGNYYLVPQAYEKTDNRNFLIYENSTFYIIQVEEAVNTAKLTESNARYYGNESYINRDVTEINQIITDVARQLAEVASTSTNARQFYIEKLDITFHDQEVKDFFVSTFPDIFDKK